MSHQIPLGRRSTRYLRAVSTAGLVLALAGPAGAARQSKARTPSPGSQADRVTTTVFGMQATVSKDGAIGGLGVKFVDVKGVRTRYYEAGQGEPIVLVHGGDGGSGHSSANTWSKNMIGLGKRYHVLAPDRLATGMTGKPLNDEDYNIHGEVEHLYQFIQTMKLGKVHLVGQSIGGSVVFYLAVAHPDVVKTLVIVNSASLAPVETAETGRPSALAKCPDAKTADCDEWRCRESVLSANPAVAFDEEFFNAGCYMANLPKGRETVAKMAAGAGEPLRSQLSEFKKAILERVRTQGPLQMPVLLYWGKDEPSAMLKGKTSVVDMRGGLLLFDIIAAKNPNVRMLIGNTIGHFLYRESPEEFNQNLLNFIDFWSRRAGAAPAKTSR